MALHMLAGGSPACAGAARRRGGAQRAASSARTSAASAPPPPPAAQRPASSSAAKPSVWDTLGSSTAERDRTTRAPPPPGTRKPAEPRSRRKGVRDGAPDPEEEDEEEALGWKVIETREGSDAGDDEARGPRALPAEMRCFDRAKVYVKAGDGGMGSTAFRREAQVSMGGPSGGNGGDGGDIWIVGDAARNSLMGFRKTARAHGRDACACFVRISRATHAHALHRTARVRGCRRALWRVFLHLRGCLPRTRCGRAVRKRMR
jgi:hypothetical protein